MTLEQSITRQLRIEQKIYQNEGELTPFTEAELEEASREVAHNIEASVFAYRSKVQELDYLKSAYRQAVRTRTEQLERFKQVLHHCALSAQKELKTPIASISARERKGQEVLIYNFDDAMLCVPDAVTIEVKDNVKKITLNKTRLKEFWNRAGADPSLEGCGFEVRDKVSKYPDIRVRARVEG